MKFENHTSAKSGSAPFDRARAYVEKIPGAIEGRHGDDQTLAVANVLVWDFALSHADAMIILREYNERCSPPWKESELKRKLRSAERQSHKKERGNMLRGEFGEWRPKPYTHRTSKLQIDPATAVENFLKGYPCDEVDLGEASLIRPAEDFTDDAIVLVESLYKPGEQVNFVTDYTLAKTKDGAAKAKPKGCGITMGRDEVIACWRKHGMPHSLAGGWLRMNPMDGKGVSDANVRSFRFALLETDTLPFDLALALFAKLPLPIAAILTSGGRGPHAWVRVDAKTADEYATIVGEMIAILAPLGLDAANKNPSRLSRLPGVIRRIGAQGDGLQRLLYLNPQPDGRPIL